MRKIYNSIQTAQASHASPPKKIRRISRTTKIIKKKHNLCAISRKNKYLLLKPNNQRLYYSKLSKKLRDSFESILKIADQETMKKVFHLHGTKQEPINIDSMNDKSVEKSVECLYLSDQEGVNIVWNIASEICNKNQLQSQEMLRVQKRKIGELLILRQNQVQLISASIARIEAMIEKDKLFPVLENKEEAKRRKMFAEVYEHKQTCEKQHKNKLNQIHNLIQQIKDLEHKDTDFVIKPFLQIERSHPIVDFTAKIVSNFQREVFRASIICIVEEKFPTRLICSPTSLPSNNPKLAYVIFEQSYPTVIIDRRKLVSIIGENQYRHKIIQYNVMKVKHQSRRLSTQNSAFYYNEIFACHDCMRIIDQNTSFKCQSKITEHYNRSFVMSDPLLHHQRVFNSNYLEQSQHQMILPYFNYYSNKAQEVHCNRYLCKSCHDKKYKNQQHQQEYICDFCKGFCNCFRCQKMDKVVKLMSYHTHLKGQTTDLYESLAMNIFKKERGRPMDEILQILPLREAIFPVPPQEMIPEMFKIQIKELDYESINSQLKNNGQLISNSKLKINSQLKTIEIKNNFESTLSQVIFCKDIQLQQVSKMVDEAKHESFLLSFEKESQSLFYLVDVKIQNQEQPVQLNRMDEPYFGGDDNIRNRLRNYLFFSNNEQQLDQSFAKIDGSYEELHNLNISL